MLLVSWDELPNEMKNESVRPYYDILSKKRLSLLFKRLFDIFIAILMLIILLPLFLVLSIWIKLDSHGPIMFRQERVTHYGKKFKIFKFRTMVVNAEQLGNQVTISNDMRVTKSGKFLRKYRLDEIPQLLNIISGDMSFVGTRPEVVKYVQHYTDEMYATLLLPAGVTSLASIKFKDEEKMFVESENADKTYVNEILPQKMSFNLQAIKEFNALNEIKLMINTLLAVLR